MTKFRKESIMQEVKDTYRDFGKDPESLGLNKLGELEPFVIYFRTQFKVIRKLYEKQIKDIKIIELEIGDGVHYCRLKAMGKIAEHFIVGKSYELTNFKTILLNNLLCIYTQRVSRLLNIEKDFSLNGKGKECIFNPSKFKNIDLKSLPYDTTPFQRDLFYRYLKLKEILKTYYLRTITIYIKESENILGKRINITKKEKNLITDYVRKLTKIVQKKDFNINILGRYFIDLTFKICMVGSLSKRYISLYADTKDVLNILVVCPELENLCNFTLWIRDKSRTYEEFEKVLINLIKDKEKKFCKLSNYKLRLPNKLLRQSASISLEEIRGYYEWYLVPYLKHSLESFTENYDPLNSILFIDPKEDELTFVPKVIEGILYKIQGEQICLMVPTMRGFLREIWIEVKDKENLQEIRKLPKGEIIYVLVGCYPSEDFKLDRFLLSYHAESNDFTDIIDDMVKKNLYQTMLQNKGLFCGTTDKLKNNISIFINNFKKGYMKYFRRKIDLSVFDYSKYESFYLQLYFHITNNKIYYVPKILSNYKNDIEKIDSYLSLGQSMDTRLMLIAEKYRLVKNLKRLGEKIE